MGLMKNIDVKSLLIGILATALLFACADADKASPSIVSEAKAATGVNDKWDDKQEWIEADYNALKAMGDIGEVKYSGQMVYKTTKGWQPHTDKMYRKRIK